VTKSASAPRVVVIGGGITGLTTAYRVLAARPDASVTILEENLRAGGKIHTDRRDGFVIDAGPDSFVAARPHATQLCKDLGLESRLVSTIARNRKVYVARDRRLHPLPEGVVLAVPTRVWPLAKSPLFSFRGKVRMGMDLALPRGDLYGDESIAHFIRRRLGRELLERLAEPLMGGIYAGDVESLSMRSTFPQLLDLEERHGSLIRGALAERNARGVPQGPPPSPFLSLMGGMGELTEALVAELERRGCRIRLGARADVIAPAQLPGARFEVRSTRADGSTEAVTADHVVVTSPAYAAATTLERLDDELAGRLRAIPYVSTGTVVLAFARADIAHPLDAVGLILPKSEGRKILAATFISSKWAGRAPGDMALLRVFVGGHRDASALDKSDAELCTLAREELASLLGIQARPAFSMVFRYPRANAQPLVGHLERILRIRMLASRHAGLHLAGAAFDGVGIPDCVRQGGEVAARIVGQP
jgi:protoporphyrinogen/coproporphyrinogen III oxidase